MIRLSDSEFHYIVQYIKENYGINLEKKRVLIECRLNRELEKYGAESFDSYLGLVKADRSHKMGEEMIHRLTTHYTYFMREFQHFEVIRDLVLPEIGRASYADGYKIWCAGCSTGEECYTLAMVMAEYARQGGVLPPYWILATDISEKVLEQAKAGIYPVKELEKIPFALRERYCKVQEDGTFRMADGLRNSIRFRKQNLMEPFMTSMQYDLILCRNVMIYFDAEIRQNMVKKLENSLRPGGYLMVGHSELISKGSTSLKCVASAVYKKE